MESGDTNVKLLSHVRECEREGVGVLERRRDIWDLVRLPSASFGMYPVTAPRYGNFQLSFLSANAFVSSRSFHDSKTASAHTHFRARAAAAAEAHMQQLTPASPLLIVSRRT